MIKTSYNGSVENDIITSMILDATTLGTISSRWEDDMFSVGWLNLIANWCIQHYRNHREAPLRSIELYFRDWAEKNQDQGLVDLVSQYLATISNKHVYDQESNHSINSQHMIDVAGKQFRKNRLNKLQEKLQHCIRTGDVDKAEELVVQHTRVELGGGSGVFLLREREAIASVFRREEMDPIITFPDDPELSSFFANEMEPEGFVVFCGPQKSGKSQILTDMVYRALVCRKKVALFSIGDLSEKQVEERLLCRIARWPTRSSDGRWPARLKLPIGILPPPKGRLMASVETRERTYDDPLTEEQAVEGVERLIHSHIKSWRDYFCLSCHPSRSISIGGIRGILEQWESQYGFVPSVIVIDYMDNLLHEEKTEKQNDRVNATWKSTKALTAERRCLILSATQVSASGFNKKVLGRSDFSEDNRKLGEVSGMVGINVTAAEKELGLTRYNWIVKRYGEFSYRRVIHCAGHLGLCSPIMFSVFPEWSPGDEEED